MPVSLFSVMVFHDSDGGKSVAKILNYFEKYSPVLGIFLNEQDLKTKNIIYTQLVT